MAERSKAVILVTSTFLCKRSNLDFDKKVSKSRVRPIRRCGLIAGKYGIQSEAVYDLYSFFFFFFFFNSFFLWWLPAGHPRRDFEVARWHFRCSMAPGQLLISSPNICDPTTYKNTNTIFNDHWCG